MFTICRCRKSIVFSMSCTSWSMPSMMSGLFLGLSKIEGSRTVSSIASRASCDTCRCRHQRRSPSNTCKFVSTGPSWVSGISTVFSTVCNRGNSMVIPGTCQIAWISPMCPHSATAGSRRLSPQPATITGALWTAVGERCDRSRFVYTKPLEKPAHCLLDLGLNSPGRVTGRNTSVLT